MFARTALATAAFVCAVGSPSSQAQIEPLSGNPELLTREEEPVALVDQPDAAKRPIFQGTFPIDVCGFGGWCPPHDKYDDQTPPDRFAHVAVGAGRVYVASGQETGESRLRMFDSTTRAALGQIAADHPMGVTFYRGELFVSDGGRIRVFDPAGAPRRVLVPQTPGGVAWGWQLRGLDAAWGEIWGVAGGGAIVVLDSQTGVIKQVLWHMPTYDCNANPEGLVFSGPDPCTEPAANVVAQCTTMWTVLWKHCQGAVLELGARQEWRDISTVPELSLAVAHCRFINRAPLLDGFALEDVTADELLSPNACDDLWHDGSDAVWGMKWYLTIGSSTATPETESGKVDPVASIYGDGATVREYALKPNGDAGPRMALKRSWALDIGNDGTRGDMAYHNREVRIDWSGDLKRTIWQRSRRCADYIVSDADIYAITSSGQHYYELARGFQKLEVLLDGAVVPFEQNGLTMTSTSNAMGRLCLNLDSHTSGDRHLRLRAVVHNGSKLVVADNDHLRIDHDPPTGAIDGLPQFVRDTVRVSGTFADAHSGRDTWHLQLFPPGGSWRAHCALAAPDAAGRYTCDWDTRRGPDGAHRVRAELRDRVTSAGGGANVGWTPERSVRVDNTPPDMTVGGDGRDRADLAPVYDEERPAVSVDARDAGSGIVAIELRVDGTERARIDQSCGGGGCGRTHTFTVDPTALTDGHHEIRVTARDSLGHERSESWTIDIEKVVNEPSTDPYEEGGASSSRSSLEPPDTPDLPLYEPIQLVIPEDVLDPASPRYDPTKFLDCTSPEERPNFDVYSLGEAFEGLPLVKQMRVCQAARPPIPFRGNFVAYIYGDCDPWAGVSSDYPRDSGAAPHAACAAPIEIQSWPICERNPQRAIQGETDPLLLATAAADEQLTIRGAPAAVYDGGEVLEVYAGTTTIAVFGDELTQMKRAAAALVREELPPGDIAEAVANGAVVTRTSPAAPLPTPMPGGLENSAPCAQTAAHLEGR